MDRRTTAENMDLNKPAKRDRPPADPMTGLRCDAYNDDPLRVARVARHQPDAADVDMTVDTLEAVASPVRLRIATALLIEPLCMCELMELIGISGPALTHHLKKLESTDLIEPTKRGRFVEYSLTRKGNTLTHILSMYLRTNSPKENRK